MRRPRGPRHIAGRVFHVYTLTLLLSAMALGGLSAMPNTFSDHRLMPLFLFRDGYPLYPRLGEGPMLSTMYPPVGLFAYWPATLFRSPRPVLITAGFLSLALSFAPVLWALWVVARDHSSWRAHVTSVFAAFFFWSTLSEIMKTAVLVHADPPALFLAAVSVVLFIQFERSHERAYLIASALASSLAPWAKQPVFPILLVAPLVLLAQRRVRAALAYCGLQACFQGVIIVGLHLLFGLDRMLVWIVEIPARHPWTSVWSTSLDGANRVLLAENMASLIILLGAAGIRLGKGQSIGDLIRAPWMISLVSGLALWPTSVLGFVKVGGANNALLYATYFISLALALFAVEVLGARDRSPERYASATRIVAVAVCLLSIPVAVTLGKTVVSPRRVWHSETVQVYDFCLRRPEEVYFPWHPLATYLGTGKAYHAELGIADRVAAGVPIDQENLRQYLPRGMRYIAYRGMPATSTLAILPDYSREVEHPELPGWVVYARP